MAEPPLDAGAVHDSVTAPSPAVPDTAVGAPGAPRGVISPDGADAAPVPAAPGRLRGLSSTRGRRAPTAAAPRLRLLVWQERHVAPFAALNADPEVMRYFPATQDEAQTRASVEAWQAQFAERGWSNWAVETRATGEFIGFIGLSVPRRPLPFSPCVEIGWRLARRFWGLGLATEGARACLDARPASGARRRDVVSRHAAHSQLIYAVPKSRCCLSTDLGASQPAITPNKCRS